MSVRLLEPAVRLGKNGLSPGVVDEISKNLKKHGIVKVKMLRSFAHGRDKKELAASIASAANAELVSFVGFVVVLKKRGVARGVVQK